MKKLILCVLLVLSFNTLQAKQAQSITVAASAIPHAQILEAIKPLLKAKGYDLVVLKYDDYTMPNELLKAGKVDANYFQHLPFLKNYNQKTNSKLVAVAKIHLEPMALYSKTNKSLIKQGDKIALPNDLVNESRALDILAKNSIISLRTAKYKNILDIMENEKDIEFLPMRPQQLPNILAEVDFAMINANYALKAGLNIKKAIIVENLNSPYINVLVTRQELANKDKIKALKSCLQSKEAKDFMLRSYKGAVIPVF